MMLQGTSAAELAALVDRVGGVLTHRLPIIDAVGARLSRAQLDAALRSDIVSRFIDDLSVSENPEDEPGPLIPGSNCGARAALVLERNGPTLTWRIYGTEGRESRLKRLDLSWPEVLGTSQQVLVDGSALQDSWVEESGDGRYLTSLPASAAPSMRNPSRVEVVLDGRAAEALQTRSQRDFAFIAGFGEDCEVRLIPGYDDNVGDTYYPTVVGADQLHRQGVTGRGVTIAVLDSGLWEAPPLRYDTRGKVRIRARYDAILDQSGNPVPDGSGHGTHLSSAMANSDPVIRDGMAPGSFKGIAPDAGLIPVRAFDDNGHGDFLDIVRGVQWIVEHRERYNIGVLNLSFAAAPRWPYWLDPINQALMRAWRAGITVIAAAGNEGPEPMTVGSPGNLPYIITVGAVTDSWTVGDRSDDYIPDFSSRGPTPTAHIKPDVVAPGGHIIGITRPGATLTQQHPEYMLAEDVLVMTGTSQAAAVVSGIAALLLQLEPNLSPDDIKCKLTTSSEPAINRDGLFAYTPFEQGNGYANAVRAVTLGQRGCGNSDLDINPDIAGRQHFEGPAIVDDAGATTLPGLDQMVAPYPAAKGHSEDRVWGVKAHIEREVSVKGSPTGQASPFNWRQLYEQEKIAIERMAADGARKR
jgi:hypothetical protein